MTITRYWYLTVDERAALTVEQVEALTKLELMEQGVLAPRPPVLVDAEPPPMDKTELLCPVVSGTRYGDQTVPVGFRTLADLTAFLALRPVFVDDDWSIDAKVGIPITGEDGKTAAVVPKATVEARRSELERAKANKESNAKENQRYSEECRASQKALEGLWADYQQARLRAHRLQRIRETYQEYLAMSNGDASVARAFLSKTKGLDAAEIGEALLQEPISSRAFCTSQETQ